MARPPRLDSAEAVGRRLRLIRIAFSNLQGYAKTMTQKDFSEFCEINRQAWNNAETGDSRLGLDNARSVRKRTGVGLNYIYDGDERDLPHPFAVEIARLERLEAESPKLVADRR